MTKLSTQGPGLEGFDPNENGHDFLVDHETYKLLRHPIVMLSDFVKGLLILFPFVFLTVFITPTLASPIEQMFLLLTLVLAVSFIGINGYVHWIMNVSILDSQQLRVYKFKSILSHTRESINLRRINTFDLKKEGYLNYFFEFADIELASILSDDENNTSVVIDKIWKAEEKIKLIKHMSYRSQN